MKYQIAAFAAATLLLSSAMGQEEPPAVGDTAPNFSLAGSDGRTHALADYRGQPVVLAWFPKAFTGG